MHRQSLFALCFALSAAGFSAAAADLEGVPLPERIQVGDAEVKLNGAGVRTRFFFKVYVATLHAERPLSSAAAILEDASQIRRVTLTMLRDVSKDQAVGAFEDALRGTFKDAYGTWRARLGPFFDLLRDAKRGDRIEITARPKLGISVVAGAQRAQIAGDDASLAMLSIWLGEHPVDRELREKLVSRAARGAR